MSVGIPNIITFSYNKMAHILGRILIILKEIQMALFQHTVIMIYMINM
jgi:hypothetical protein